MTPRDLIRETSLRFSRAGITECETDSSLLLSFLTHVRPLNLRLDNETILDEKLLDEYERLVQRRLSREPLQYITSEAPFCGRIFYVDSRVLIPRPETELLCRWALEPFMLRSGASVLDLCCGSGCIGLTIAAERPDLNVTLSDISENALEVAEMNAKRFGLSVSLLHCDLLSGIPSDSFDAILSNPPYIPSADCPHLQPEVLSEPITALDGGGDGLFFYRRIASEAMRVLRKDGRLMMEVGFGESGNVSDLLSESGFTELTVRKDFQGIDRMIAAGRTPMEDICLND